MDVEAVLKTLTLEEKISLLSGETFSNTQHIPSKGVPFIKTADGPNGIRSAAIDKDVKSACFPAACSLAATFDVDLARRVGHALAHEARNKGVHCSLGPTVCIHRHPLGGRNFESFSEDPLVAGRMSSQVIQGLQEKGISATIKHFAANEQETQRTSVNETISQRALREIYLKPFEIAIKEAKPWAIMTAYNLVNGVHCDGNPWLLQKVLKEEWGFNGLIMSDWGGTNSVANAINAGMDIEMPGPPRVRKTQAVLDAIKDGATTEAQVTDRARSVLKWTAKLKSYEKPSQDFVSDLPEHRALIREAGAKGMVLLKNDHDLLPLTKEKCKVKKIALIGFANDAMTNGGGSASVNAYYKITPSQGLQGALGDTVEFTHAKGFHRERLLPPLEDAKGCGSVAGLDGKPGFTRILIDSNDEESTKTLHGTLSSAYSPLGSQESLWRAVEIVGDFSPGETGHHYIACSGLGPTRVWVNDELVYEQTGNCTDPMGSLFLAAPEPEFRYNFTAGQAYRLRVRSEPPVKIGLDILEGRSGMRVGFSLESIHDADMEGEAVAVARDADVAIVFTGHDPQWETEGRDQDSFDLPQNQNAVVSAVASVNKNTIVVNSTGVAISMPWLDQVPGIVQAWFPGQEAGNAIADVLTGAICPEGRLPVSFPKNIEDAPAHGSFPGQYVDGQLEVSYDEGVFVGYRHFDRTKAQEPNFSFGFGLSYTSFEYDEFNVQKVADEETKLRASVKLANTGSIAGGEVLQVYAGRASRHADHPIKQLVAFKRVYLEPGKSEAVELEFSAKDFAFWSEDEQSWRVDKGDYSISLASSAAAVIKSLPVHMAGASWKP